MVLGSSPVAVTSPSDFAPASSKEFLDIQATIECGFTLKRVRDMTRTYSQKRNSWFNFPICHWNLNSLTAHNFEKVNLLEACNTVYKFDIICSSNSFLDSSILTKSNNLKINGYKMIRPDHPNNVKKRGVCGYIRKSLPVRNFSNSYLNECLTLQIATINRKGYVITLYRYPCQAFDEFDSFISSLEKLLIITGCDPHFVMLVGDINAKSKFLVSQ